ncbi:MAG: 16S rRNA (cytidine(1402)-2'-O)-methyltransferase [Hyphomicrobiaceae bacterium]
MTDAQQAPDMAALERMIAGAMRQALRPGLYVIATPIGNLADLTLRAVVILSRADRIYAEDTRVSRRLLAAYGLVRPIRVYNDHSGEQVRDEIVGEIAEGGMVALVSDAGTPLISDPGYKLVRAVCDMGHQVFAVPGPSALTAMLSISGLPTDQVLFAGFLPSKASGLRRRLEALAAVPATLVIYEAPQRIAQLIDIAHEVLGDRQAAIGRELTKLHEAVVRGSLCELRDTLGGMPQKGELVVAIAGPDPAADAHDITDDVIVTALDRELARAGLAQAAKAVSLALGVPKSRVFAIGRDLKRGSEVGPEGDRREADSDTGPE